MQLLPPRPAAHVQAYLSADDAGGDELQSGGAGGTTRGNNNPSTTQQQETPQTHYWLLDWEEGGKNRLSN